MKTFNDLKFVLNPYSEQAILNFPNGFGISVLCGTLFYSNGIDNYEVAVLKDNELFYSELTNNDVLGYQSEKQITRLMRKIQRLPKDYESKC